MLEIGAKQLLNQVLSGIENLDQVFFGFIPNTHLHHGIGGSILLLEDAISLLRCWIWDNLCGYWGQISYFTKLDDLVRVV